MTKARKEPRMWLAALGAAALAGSVLPAFAGSAGAVGTDYVVSADSSESEYRVAAPIDGYARLVKRGSGKVVLSTPTTEFAGNVVIEEGALFIETAGGAELQLNGTLSGGSTGTSDILFRKKGTGVLCLNGDVDLARNVQVDQGLMEMTSAAARAYAGWLIMKGASRTLIGNGRMFANSIRVGLDSYGVFHQTGGILGVGGTTEIGTGSSSIGHWAMSGGEAYMSNSVYLAKSSGGFGSFIQTGGLFKLEADNLYAGNSGSAVFHVGGGTNDTRIAVDGQYPRFRAGEAGGCADVTVSGEGTLLATETLRFGGGTVSTNIFNVKDGATVKAARFFKHRSAAAGSFVNVNADGGMFRPTMAYDWTGSSQTAADYGKGMPDHFVVWKKGLVLDTSDSAGNNPSSTVPFAFEAPSGKGVESIVLPTDGGYATAEYFGPARIVFEDETGWGASAYAEYDFAAKKHTRVVITSRGCDYGENAKAYVESPDRTARYACTLVLSDNAGLGGEVVKRGEHDLHLYATNTATGGLAVESGTLYAETAGVIPSNTPVRVEYGATLVVADPAPLALSSFTGAGSVPGHAIAVTQAVRARCADLFDGKFAAFDGLLTFAPGATFTIVDPENLEAYAHAKSVTAFTAAEIVGAPTLAFAGTPARPGRWRFVKASDTAYRFGSAFSTTIVIR